MAKLAKANCQLVQSPSLQSELVTSQDELGSFQGEVGTAMSYLSVNNTFLTVIGASKF